MKSHNLGSLVHVTADFRNSEDHSAVDPTTVHLNIRTPDGALVEYTFGIGGFIGRDDVGLYYANLDITQSGEWIYNWFSRGFGQAAKERKFKVPTADAVVLSMVG